MIQPGCILTEEELAKALDVEGTTIRNWSLRYGLQFRRPGCNRRLFVSDEVIAFIESQPGLTRDSRGAKVGEQPEGLQA